MTSDIVSNLISTHRFHFTCEEDLQAGIESLLRGAELPYIREARLSPRDRPDFFTKGLAIEIKVKGSRTNVLRQLMRYAKNEQVEEILLVTTRSSHRAMPETIGGVPLSVAYIPPL